MRYPSPRLSWESSWHARLCRFSEHELSVPLAVVSLFSDIACVRTRPTKIKHALLICVTTTATKICTLSGDHPDCARSFSIMRNSIRDMISLFFVFSRFFPKLSWMFKEKKKVNFLDPIGRRGSPIDRGEKHDWI